MLPRTNFSTRGAWHARAPRTQDDDETKGDDLATLGVMVALIATGVATLASPVAAAETTSSDVAAVAYGPLPEQLLDVRLPTTRPARSR